MMCFLLEVINSAGLVLDIGGVILGYRYGLPPKGYIRWKRGAESETSLQEKCTTRS